MTTKICFKCNVDKPLVMYYKHKQMGDGHLNKCKSCTKNDTKERETALRKNPDWVEKEKARAREKYHRLKYREKHKPTPQQKKETMDRYKKKYPEKTKAKIASQHLPKRNKENHLHHWSYNKMHCKDVIELSVKEHNIVHRFLKYDQPSKFYKTRDGAILNTREAHLNYIDQVLSAELSKAVA